jgi:hypothetical protein
MVRVEGLQRLGIEILVGDSPDVLVVNLALVYGPDGVQPAIMASCWTPFGGEAVLISLVRTFA